MKVEVALGEIFDKITILDIKLDRIQDSERLMYVRGERDVLDTALQNEGFDIDLDNSVDATIQRVLDGEPFSSKFMDEEQNAYINQYVDTINYYGEDDLWCESNIAVIRKK